MDYTACQRYYNVIVYGAWVPDRLLYLPAKPAEEGTAAGAGHFPVAHQLRCPFIQLDDYSRKKKGLLNNTLLSLGVIQEPLNILYTPTAMIIGLIHLFLPLIIITLVGVMENIDSDLVKAAESLGASRFSAFCKIIIPLSVPGLIIGGILVFVGSLTAYTTPALLGGKQRVISTFLYQNAITLNDWYLASVIATIMMVITFIIITLMNKLAAKLNPKGS